MSFRDLINKLLGKDPIYSNVKRGQENDYQACFLIILNSVDVQNLTNRAHSRSFNQELAEKDLKTIDNFAVQAKSKAGLLPVILQVMVEQYIWADPLQREQDRNHWIYRVMNRERMDYFPDALRVYHALFK